MLVLLAIIAFLCFLNAHESKKMSASFDALKVSISAAEAAMSDAAALIAKLVAMHAGETVDPADVASVQSALDSATAALKAAAATAPSV